MQTRRTFLAMAATAASLSAMGVSAQTARAPIQAVAFDVFTIFDPRSLDTVAESHFPGKGKELAALWIEKLFNYFWLRTLNGRYVDCRQAGAEALRFACDKKGLAASPEAIETMVDVFSHLKLWPDAAGALQRMHDAGLRMAYLSNLTESMLRSSSEGVGISSLFEHYLSTDRVRAYKPDPRSYAMAETAFGLQRRQILFAATGGWDYAGAKSFGLETYWVNRAGSPREYLGVEPDGEGLLLTDFADYAIAQIK